MFGAKRKRISRACDRCHKLGRKCTPAAGSICQPCIDYGDECTYNRPQGKRGARPKKDGNGGHRQTDKSHLPPPETVLRLVEIYRIAVYPIYPFFSWPHFLADVTARRQEGDPPFRTTVLAMCALVAARMRDGACAGLVNSFPDINDAELEAAARINVSAADFAGPPAFDHLRACALLIVLAMQNGDVEQIHTWMGKYTTLSAILNHHDERKWPPGLTGWQRQERRALYWSTYKEDVFTSSVWGGIVRHRAARSFVEYPDRQLDSGEAPVSWLVGWNGCTDMYRALERILDSAASVDVKRPPALPGLFNHPAPLPIHAAWTAINDMYESLPAHLKVAAPVTGDLTQDMYSFQAADLIVTLQAVKMTIACSQPMSMDDRCKVASELLDSLAKIPSTYMMAISAPFLHQLGGVASLLGSVVQGPLTLASYIYVRQILLDFASLLAGLEISLRSNISQRLLEHVGRIDAFMQEAAPGDESMGKSAVSAMEHAPTTTHHPPPHTAVPEHNNNLFHSTVSADASEVVFTLPDDILQLWPFNDDQPLILDGF